MTPTTLQALRRLLFFSRHEAALLVATNPEQPEGVSDEQWRQWEEGDQPIPAYLVQKITELVDWRSTALAATADTIRQQIKDKGIPEAVFIIWYENLADWKSLPNRDPLMWRLQQAVCAALVGMFSTIHLVPFNGVAYAGWLADREDTEVDARTMGIVNRRTTGQNYLMSTLPNCPQCHSEYTYEDGNIYICPECAHEWSTTLTSTESPTPQSAEIRDAVGNVLKDGDSVSVIKDLKVKGSSLVVKVGTKVKNIRLVDGDHDIDCKIDGIGAMQLKSEFVKKV